MRSAAIAMACSPEEQKRLMVTPGTASGSPARKRGHARHVHSRFAFRIRAAENHVVDFVRRNCGIFFQQAPEHGRGQVVRARGSQRSARRFPDRGAKTIDNYGFSH